MIINGLGLIMIELRLVAIGDLHGRNCWREVDVDLYDKVVFMGDYVDSFTLSDRDIYTNLKKVIQLKRALPEKIVLLLGNHDIQYLHFPIFRIAGYRQSMQPKLADLFNKNRDCFQMAYQYKDYLFTHAGVTSFWWHHFLKSPMVQTMDIHKYSIAAILNHVESAGTIRDREVLYNEGHYTVPLIGCGSPIWATALETSIDMLPGIHQIAGHVQVERPQTVEFSGRSMTYIDCLHSGSQFFELTI
jgi:hypothetical protein